MPFDFKKAALPTTEEESVAPMADVPGRKFEFLSPQHIISRPPPRWLIRDLLIEGCFTIIYAQSRSYKSYIALNIAAQIATGGCFWPNEPVRKTGVVSVVLEGAYGMGTRLAAWQKHYHRTLIADT